MMGKRENSGGICRLNNRHVAFCCIEVLVFVSTVLFDSYIIYTTQTILISIRLSVVAVIQVGFRTGLKKLA